MLKSAALMHFKIFDQDLLQAILNTPFGPDSTDTAQRCFSIHLVLRRRQVQASGIQDPHGGKEPLAPQMRDKVVAIVQAEGHNQSHLACRMRNIYKHLKLENRSYWLQIQLMNFVIFDR